MIKRNFSCPNEVHFVVCIFFLFLLFVVIQGKRVRKEFLSERFSWGLKVVKEAIGISFSSYSAIRNF